MDSEQREAERVDRAVHALLKGRRPRLGAKDAASRDVLMTAAALVGARHPFPGLSPDLRRRLSRAFERTAPGEGVVTRRAALAAAVTFGAGLGGAAAFAFLRREDEQPSPTYRPQVTEIVPKEGVWLDVGALADLPDGQPVRVTAGAVTAFVIREGESVRALSGVCTDLPCLLEGGADQLVCPCHRVAFDLQGHAQSRYALPALPSVRVQVVDGRVEVLGT